MVAYSKSVFVAAFAYLAAAPLAAGQPVTTASVPMDCNFDLQAPDRIERDDAMQRRPQVPRGTDLRAVAFDPPAVAITLALNGPVLSAGALGKTRKGVPGLAHVAIGWDF